MSEQEMLEEEVGQRETRRRARGRGECVSGLGAIRRGEGGRVGGDLERVMFEGEMRR